MNGRCPICGDSEKKKRKKRFYLLEKEGSFSVYCHNCNYSKSFIGFIKEKFPDKYSQLDREIVAGIKDKFLHKTKPKEEIEKEKPNDLKTHEYFLKYFAQTCIKLDDPQQNEKKEKWRKYAISILTKRNIPQDFQNKCFVCVKGKYEWRIIIPFINDKGYYYNFQARDIYPKEDEYRKNTKYLFASFEDVELPEDKVYNRYNVDASKIVYICEGIFKSLFVKNSIALCNANVKGDRFDSFKKQFPKRIWVMDSPHIDKTGYNCIKELLEMGESCFIIPEEHKDCKDLDELACKLKVSEFSEEYMKEHTIKGRLALMKLMIKKVNL